MMILNTTVVQAQQYQQASQRWRFLWRTALIITVIIQALAAGLIYQHIHHTLIMLKPLQHNIAMHAEQIAEIKRWKAAVAQYEEAMLKRKDNIAMIDMLYERLEDFQSVNLRLLRIKKGYLYCGVAGITEKAVKQYQAYLKKSHYKAGHHQLIDNIWFLEFTLDETA